MTTRSLVAASLAAALCSASMAATSAAQEKSPTSVTITKRPGSDGNGNITLQGYVKSGDANCRKDRAVTLYRTVNSGFGDSTTKVGKPKTSGPKNRWTYKVRRSGTYLVRVAATDRCAAAASKKLKYTRFIG